ncbi:MAG: UbiA family prenyltransferase [Candidatus Aenigmarchaeota archaeon]|nr:UbiA family prenyltransferase [Candidatus Aenigmarchaeota archaeon]
MWPILELIRPFNCALASLGVLAGGFLVAKTITLPLLIAAAAAFVITGAGNSINDFFDVEPDKINRPKRPIPSGRISRGLAMAITLAMFGFGMLLSSMVNWLTFFIAMFNSFMLVLYSFNFQSKMLVGNIAVSYLAASTFIFGGAAVNNLMLPIILSVLAGLATLSREIVKDLEDLEGDRRSFIKKMTMKMRESFGDRFRVSTGGIKLRYKTVYAVLIATFSLWMAVIISSLPYMWSILGLSYLVIVVPTDAVFLIASFLLIRRRVYGRVSKLIKLGMALGMIAFIAGVLV